MLRVGAPLVVEGAFARRLRRQWRGLKVRTRIGGRAGGFAFGEEGGFLSFVGERRDGDRKRRLVSRGACAGTGAGA